MRPLLILLLTTPAALAQDKDASARLAWRYAHEGKTGYLFRTEGKNWQELTLDGTRYHFQEMDRTPGHVDLLDPSRELWLRLHADRGQWRLKKGDWVNWYAGSWIPPSELPPNVPSDHKIRLVYFVPRDRRPTPDHADKIRVILHFVAELYQADLEAKGYKPRRLTFEEEDGKPRVHLVHGAREAAYYNGAPKYDAYKQYDRVAKEIPEAVGNPGRNVLILFNETYDDGPAEFEWPGGLALGARHSADGGLAMFSAWILRAELCAPTIEQQRKLFFDETPIKGRRAMGHGGLNSPRFEFIEDGFGAVAHELGHALGLAHDTRDQDIDVMSNGFRNFRRILDPKTPPHKRVGFSEENARLLMASRYLGTDLVLTDNTPPRAKLTLPKRLDAGATALPVSFSATDDVGLRAVVFFIEQHDSVAGGRELTGREQAFDQRLEVRPLKKGMVTLRAQVADRGGNLATVSAAAVVE